jgi:hypothetical protein
VSGQSADAVVIEAGHSGPVTGRLADVGWDVLVLETQAEPGGAVKSAELLPGYVSDLYSAFYPRRWLLRHCARSTSKITAFGGRTRPGSSVAHGRPMTTMLQ